MPNSWVRAFSPTFRQYGRRRAATRPSFATMPTSFPYECGGRTRDSFHRRRHPTSSFADRLYATTSSTTTTTTTDQQTLHDSSSSSSSSSSITNEEDEDDDEEEERLFQELKVLSEEMIRHDRAYYCDAPAGNDTATVLIPDEEYDALAQREAELCRSHPRLLQRLQESSPLGALATRFGGRVGPVLAVVHDEHDAEQKQPRVRHLEGEPMLSLDNAMDVQQVVAWLERLDRLLVAHHHQHPVTVGADNKTSLHVSSDDPHTMTMIAEPKMDGLSLSLRYRLVTQDDTSDHNTYELSWGATRGDGTQGEDVTNAVREICRTTNNTDNNIPLTMTINGSGSSPPDLFEVRGEIILPIDVFQQMQSSIQDSNGNATAIFTNARNAASGILRRTKNVSDKEFQQLRSSLRFYAYDIVVPPASSLSSLYSFSEASNGTATDMRRFLHDVGFALPHPVALIPISPSLSTNTTTVHDENSDHVLKLLRYHATLLASRPDLDFEVDGAVYKLDRTPLRAVVGTSTRAPRWAVAHKFPSATAVTRLLDVEIQVGRTGVLTPVAVLEPVDLNGVVVSRASLHNFPHARSVLGTSLSPGESVVVARAGDVIPQVLRRVLRNDDDDDDNSSSNTTEATMISLDTPLECPACGGKVVFDISSTVVDDKKNNNITMTEEQPQENQTNPKPTTTHHIVEEEGKIARCGGPQLSCRPRAVGALAHAFSRRALDVTGLSEARIAQLMDAHHTTTGSSTSTLLARPSDIFRMHERTEDVAALPGWGPKSANKLSRAVAAVSSRGVTLDRFVYSLSIRHVGSNTSKLIAAAYGSAAAFLEAVREAGSSGSGNEEERPPFVALVGDGDDDDNPDGVKGIGPIVVASLVRFSRQEVLVEAAHDLMESVLVHDDASVSSTIGVDTAAEDTIPLPWHGKTVVFTGSIAGMSRTVAQDTAKKLLGVTATPSTVSKATDLVVEGEKGGSKVKKARDMNIDVLPSSVFLDMVQQLAIENGADGSVNR